MHSLLNDRNVSLRTEFCRKNRTEESGIYRYIAKVLATSGSTAVPHLRVAAAIESQRSLGLLNKRVDQIDVGKMLNFSATPALRTMAGSWRALS